MSRTRGVLDYASPPKKRWFRSIPFAIAMLFFYAAMGAIIGFTFSPSIFPPMYASLGCIKLQVPKERTPLMPQQWKPQSIIAAAWQSTRRAFPVGQLLPSSPAEALSHASILAVPHTNLVAVMYTARDPVAAQCMAAAMVDLCLATPATDSGGAKLVAQKMFDPMPPTQPMSSKTPLLAGVAGALVGIGICLVLLRLQKIWPRSVA